LLAVALPVAVDGDLLRRPQHLEAVVGAVEEHIQVELELAEIVFEIRRIVVPGGEDQAAVEMGFGLLEAEFRLGADIAVHLFLFHRRADEIPVRAKRPAAGDTSVTHLVASLPEDHTHAPWGADIEGDVELPLAIPGNEHLVFPHGAHHVVVGIGNLRFVAHQVPAHGEEVFQFPLVKLGVAQHLDGDLAAIAANQVVEGLAVGEGTQTLGADVHGEGSLFRVLSFGRADDYRRGARITVAQPAPFCTDTGFCSLPPAPRRPGPHFWRGTMIWGESICRWIKASQSLARSINNSLTWGCVGSMKISLRMAFTTISPAASGSIRSNCGPGPRISSPSL